jgi:hypothetical protein
MKQDLIAPGRVVLEALDAPYIGRRPSESSKTAAAGAADLGAARCRPSPSREIRAGSCKCRRASRR